MAGVVVVGRGVRVGVRVRGFDLRGFGGGAGIGRGLRILRAAGRQGADGQCKREGEGNLLQLHGSLLGSVGSELVRQSNVYVAVDAFAGADGMLQFAAFAPRSEGRRVGKEWVRRWRSRGSPL